MGTVCDVGTSLVDGILDEFAGLKGLGDYDEDRRDKEIAGKDACVSGGKVGLIVLVLLLVICKLA